MRDRYPNSQWLVFTNMIRDTAFASGDILIVSEWVVPNRAELMDVLYRARQQGARVIYIGAVANESDELKRQLALLQVYDFLFFDDEIVLGKIDALMENPRTARDVEVFLGSFASAFASMAPPAVVDVYEEENAPSSALQPEVAERTWLARRKGYPTTHDPSSTESGRRPRKIVWTQTDPVCVRVVGDAGAGVTTILWNLAALCNERELPTAVVETERFPLMLWTDLEQGVHVYDERPHKGYRILLSSREKDAKQADLTIAVTFPDTYRMERLQQRLTREGTPPQEVLWVINHTVPGFPLLQTLTGCLVVYLAHDVRQWGAMRMKRPLCQMAPTWRESLAPIADVLASRYLEQVKGGQPDVALAGV